MSIVENVIVKKKGFELNIPYLELADQGVHILCGPSGSGKTTLLRTLLGLERAQGMKWTMDGVDLAQLPIAERRLGVVFQTLDLFPHMTALENIIFAGEAREIATDEIQEKVTNWSAKLQMNSFLDRKAAVLSGGEQQRVALVRALIGNPRMLLLDEPLNQLDQFLRDEAKNLMVKVVGEVKIPVLMITHDERDFREFSARITEIRNGQLQSKI